MNLKILEEVGLSEGEVKVYLALLKLGSVKTGKLAIMADVSSSKIYKILDRLEKKGLVGYVLKAGIKYFTALEPKRLVDYIEEKEQLLNEKKEIVEKMLPQLEKQRRLGEKTEAVIYDGFIAVTNFFRGLLDELKSGEVYYVIGAGYGKDPRIRRFFYKHHQKRAAKKIKIRMLANYDVKTNIEETTMLNSKIRFLPQYLITNMEIVFYKNKAFIALWINEPKGFLIESDEAVKSFQAYFNAFWKLARI